MSEENEKDAAIIETREKVGKRVDPILKYLDVETLRLIKMSLERSSLIFGNMKMATTYPKKNNTWP